jgi:molecular chaperone DnaK (HSP70)
VQLGIDFGTTRTVVAFADRGNYPVVDFVDHHGDAIGWIPSMVAARGDELRFGFDAAAVAGDASFTTLHSFKRLLSDPHAGPGREVRIGDATFPLGEILSGFLGYVREAILVRLRKKKTSLATAIAVPANALGAQRLTTVDAFRRAGFEVGAMLNEPSAAGFEYTHRHRSTLSARRDLVVVYDLGGGTFDASAVRMSGARHEVLATGGIAKLGGDDFDEVLARTALLPLDLDFEALPSSAARALLLQCREAKERLHPSSRKIVIDLDAALGPLAPRPEIVVQTADFYEACAPLVARTIDAMTPVMTRFEGEARDFDDVAGIYVVGGASELPIVARTLRDRFGRRVHRSPHPSAAVAIGLAIAQDRTAEYALVDRYARTFGVFREGDGGREIVFDAIFDPETELPARDAAPLTRTREYRAAHNVGHYRFFECAALDAKGLPRGDMTVFGDVRFPFEAPVVNASAIPIERRAAGPRIEESYSLDARGIVQVVIRNLDAGYEQAYHFGAAQTVPSPRLLQ